MSNYLNIDIPTFFAYLDTSFLYDKLPDVLAEKIPVEVFSFTSIPQRCGLFSVMTEYGSQHARVPIHYLRTDNSNFSSNYPLDWIQLWDSISYYASVNINAYTKNRAAKVILKDQKLEEVQYLFTIDWCLGNQYQNGYGEMAAGHKCGHFFKGNGQYFLQPNNRVLWMDGGSWISKSFNNKPSWKVFSKEFSCEHTGNRWVSKSDEEEYFYEFKKVDDE